MIYIPHQHLLCCSIQKESGYIKGKMKKRFWNYRYLKLEGGTQMWCTLGTGTNCRVKCWVDGLS